MFTSSSWPTSAAPSPTKPLDGASGEETPPGFPEPPRVVQAATPDTGPVCRSGGGTSEDPGDRQTSENSIGSTPEGGQEPIEGDRSPHPQRERRDSGEAQPAKVPVTDDARAHRGARIDGDASSEKTRDSGSASFSSSVDGRGKGRRRGGGGNRRSRSRRCGNGSGRKTRSAGGNSGGGGGGAGEDGSPAKVDTEWENEIAKNILSLYQTKLKADLDVKKSAKEDELAVRYFLVILVV